MCDQYTSSRISVLENKTDRIDGARFKRPVEPGDQLIMDVTLERMKAGIFKFKGIARVGDEVACEAELMCTMRTIA